MRVFAEGSPGAAERATEIALRRTYRKALAAGDGPAAEALASEVRRRYDASFS